MALCYDNVFTIVNIYDRVSSKNDIGFRLIGFLIDLPDQF